MFYRVQERRHRGWRRAALVALFLVVLGVASYIGWLYPNDPMEGLTVY